MFDGEGAPDMRMERTGLTGAAASKVAKPAFGWRIIMAPRGRAMRLREQADRVISRAASLPAGRTDRRDAVG